MFGEQVFVSDVRYCINICARVYLNGEGFATLADDYLQHSVEGSVSIGCYFVDEVTSPVCGLGLNNQKVTYLMSVGVQHLLLGWCGDLHW